MSHLNFSGTCSDKGNCVHGDDDVEIPSGELSGRSDDNHGEIKNGKHFGVRV